MIEINVVIGYWRARIFKDREPELYFSEDLKNITNKTKLFPCIYYNYFGKKEIKYFNAYVAAYDTKGKILKKEILLKIYGLISKKENNLKDKKIFFEPLPKGTHYLELIKVALTYKDNSSQIILDKEVAVYKENTSPKTLTKKIKNLKLWSSIYKNFTKAIKK